MSTETLVPFQVMLTWDQLFAQMPKTDNMIWKAFCQKYRPTVEQELAKKSTAPVTEEAIMAELADLVVKVEHPAHIYLHIFKCSHCPEFHRAESPCFLISARTVGDQSMGEGAGKAILKDVILAFPVASEGNALGALFVVQRNIPELKLLHREDHAGFVFTDPVMAVHAVDPTVGDKVH
jgi:hypothetical protein